jgi:hypothetical protein
MDTVKGSNQDYSGWVSTVLFARRNLCPDQHNKTKGTAFMDADANARQAYYSAGSSIGTFGHVLHTDGKHSTLTPEGELFIHRMGLLAQAKYSSSEDFAACRRSLPQSEEGRAVMEGFVCLWPLIEKVAKGLIEAKDFSGEKFNREFPARLNAALESQRQRDDAEAKSG